ncbi:hypothetical protein OXX69_003046 [Metschnikowia pulcherrima]
MAYFQTEPQLEFDEANAFLAALADTVPQLDKASDWNREFDLSQPFSPVFEPKFEPSSPEVISSTGSIDEMFGSSNESDFSNQMAPLYSQNDNMYMPSAEEAENSYANSYANSLGSTVSPYMDFSPHSGHSSFSPQANDNLFQPELAPEIGPNFGALGDVSEFQPETESEPHTMSPYGGPEDDYEPSEKSTKPTDLKAKAKSARVSKPERKPKTSHNVIEKKYRTSINSKILELREVVPTLKFATGKARVSMADLDGLSPACKLNKASILTKANEYIHHMKKKNKKLQSQISEIQELISQAEASPVSPSRQYPDNLNSYSYLEPNTTHMYQRRQQQPDSLFSNYSTFTDSTQAPVPVQAEPQSQNANLFFGGLATLMGSSYINDNNFQAMSAVPLFPLSAKKRQGQKNRVPEPVSWALSTIGIRPRDAFNDTEKNRVLAYLSGSTPASMADWVKTYLRLRTKENSFETILLQFLVGSVIIKKGFALSKLVALDMKWKRRALATAPYPGTETSLQKLQRLIKTVDGLSMFSSDTFAQRLYNVAHCKPICYNIANGENASLFADSLLRNEADYYAVLFEWRVLEIVHELTLVYLEILAVPTVRDDELEQLKSDSGKLRELIGSSTYLSRQFSYFELLLAPDSSPQVLKSDRKYILETLQKVNTCFEEPELTDDEQISDDESFVSAEETNDVSTRARTNSLDLIKNEKSMVCSLNLMNAEKFIVLLSSSIAYYSRHAGTDKSLHLLNHLKMREGKNAMSLLSFTCLLKLLSTFLKTENEDTDATSPGKKCNDIASSLSSRNCQVLESLIKAMNGWLDDDTKSVILTHNLRSDLSNLIISKGIALNKL